MFADRWAGSQGFNPGWQGSDPIHAVGGKSALGPYTDKGYAYSDSSFGSDPHHGHNSQVVALLNGTYAMIVSEVVPFTIFTASSLDGPWTPCSGSPGSGLSVPSGFGGNTNYASNVSLVVRPDGNFEITQRHGLLALSTNGICGPYKAQQPTNTYPSNEAIPSQYSASIFPNRQKHSDPMGPSTVESTYWLAEDPVIWFSGGQYHVLYDYPDDRVGYHLTSTDGIHNWTDQGLAYDPRYAQQIFSYTDGTVDHWFKMERPNVVIENGLITHVTFAVSDVDKNNQISAGTNHGSKVIVVPFDGVTFDKDTGVTGTGGAGGGGGAAGSRRNRRQPRDWRGGRFQRGDRRWRWRHHGYWRPRAGAGGAGGKIVRSRRRRGLVDDWGERGKRHRRSGWIGQRRFQRHGRIIRRTRRNLPPRRAARVEPAGVPQAAQERLVRLARAAKGTPAILRGAPPDVRARSGARKRVTALVSSCWDLSRSFWFGGASRLRTPGGRSPDVRRQARATRESARTPGREPGTRPELCVRTAGNRT